MRGWLPVVEITLLGMGTADTETVQRAPTPKRPDGDTRNYTVSNHVACLPVPYNPLNEHFPATSSKANASSPCASPLKILSWPNKSAHPSSSPLYSLTRAL